MKVWMVKTVFNYLLPYLIEWLTKKLLSSQLKKKLENKEWIVEADLDQILNRDSRRLPEK